MKKPKTSKTESKIREALPEVEIDGELASLTDDLDRLEIWASFKNSPLGREFYEEVGRLCASKINVVLKDHRKLGDITHDVLSEVNVLVSLLDRMDRAENELPDLQEEIDSRVEQLVKITRQGSGGSNAGL